jgi:hypothetical protein
MFAMISKEDNISWLQQRVAEYRIGKGGTGEVVEDFDEVGKLGQGFVSLDELKEINLGGGVVHHPTYVNTNLAEDQKHQMIELLREFMDCFAWEYTEMSGLSQDVVEHALPIKQGFRPHKQPPQNYNPELLDRIKEEIKCLLNAKFIRPCRYAEWVSNIMSVEKKNSKKIRVCVDYQNLNKATPKDEYPMPMADMLINRVFGNKIISFLDSNVGYNQIFMTEDDVAKTALCFPGFIGLFEWVVMTFGLKNAGAMYQRAMNLIFHDLLGVILEVYIDDLVIKLAGFAGHLAHLRLVFQRMKSYNLKMNPLKCAFGVSSRRFLEFIMHEQGIEVDPKKLESIKKLGEPTCKRDVQKLLGKINYL